MHPRSTSYLLALLLFAAGCATHRLEIPRPHLQSRKQVEPAPSVVALPIELDLRTMEAWLDVQLPPVLQDDIDRLLVPGTHVHIQYLVQRGPVLLRARGNRVRGRLEARWWAGLCVKQEPSLLPLPCVELASCGPDVSALELDTRIALKPTWTLSFDTSYEMTPGPRCTLSPIHLDATGLVEHRIHDEFDDLVTRMDRELPELLAETLRTEAAKAWRFLQHPIRLRPGLWLLFAPEAVWGDGIAGDAHRLTTTLRVRVAPRIAVGPRPPAGEAPLPAIDLGAAPQPTLQVAVSARVPLHELTREAQRELVGKRLDVNGRKVEIRDIRVEAAEGSDVPVVAVDVKGIEPRLEARIYLTAVPHWDPAKDRLVLGQLDFSLETRNVLVRSADWLMHPSLRKQLEQALENGVDLRLNELIDLVNHELHRKIGRSVRMRGELLGVDSVEAAVRGDELEAAALVRAKVELRVRPAVPIHRP